jgi:UDP:flavonoid glycosyltransferase YjiC (YdhE family)
MCTHGGHGTFMRALRHGVPMIVIPGIAQNQAPNAALAEKLGVGLALPGDASGASIQAAAEMSGVGGAQAAAEIEALSRAAG